MELVYRALHACRLDLDKCSSLNVGAVPWAAMPTDPTCNLFTCCADPGALPDPRSHLVTGWVLSASIACHRETYTHFHRRTSIVHCCQPPAYSKFYVTVPQPFFFVDISEWNISTNPCRCLVFATVDGRVECGVTTANFIEANLWYHSNTRDDADASADCFLGGGFKKRRFLF